MSELLLNKDYHSSEVHRAVRWPEGGTRGYFAACDGCGWKGRVHAVYGTANDDAVAHDVTHNPEVRRG